MPVTPEHPDRDTIALIRRETPFQGYFRVDRYTLRHPMFAGGMTGDVVREVFERGHAAALLPYDPARDEVVLIEQFRVGAYAAGEAPWLIEIVAGIIEPGETPEGVVLREGVEEAGLAVADLLPLGKIFVSPGGSTETVEIYCGRCDSSGAGGIHGLASEDEDIRVIVRPFAGAMSDLADGLIRSAPAVIALQWLALNRDALLRHWSA
ncbi:MAG: NUDIX domain-containing protein [Alphaproteobacteria bacterium]|jgi:ADP-ribose pyrophosphatase